MGRLNIHRLLILSGLMHGLLWGHSNPWGDTAPLIEVRDGNFSVTFSTKDRSDFRLLSYPHSRIIYAPDGKVLVPRHRLEEEPPPLPYASTGRSSDSSKEVQAIEAGGLCRFVVVKNQLNAAPQEEPLALEPQKSALVEATTFAGSLIGFTWQTMGTLPGVPDYGTQQLHLAHVEANGARPGSTVCLGKPATIYDSPSASAPVWAGGRWWVAWVREASTPEERKDPLKQWQTLLSSYDPATRELKHKVLEEISNWNTNVDLKTTGGWLCVAWHASVDGSYPGVAKICAVFEKVPAN